MSGSRPDGLFISVSQVKTYLRCPRQYELRYVRGVAPAFVPVPLAFGTSIHAALKLYYERIREAEVPPSLNDLETAFAEAWVSQSTGKFPLQATEDEDGGPDHATKGREMLAVFHAHATAQRDEVVAVELPFTVDLHHPQTGEVLDEQLTGVMDLVLAEEGHHVVVEHKSAAKKYTADQLRYDIQPTCYSFAARQLGWGDVGLRYQVLTKTKTPVVQVADIHRDEGDEGDFLRTAVGVLRAIDAGAFFPIRGWQCRSCPYSAACRPQR